MIGSNCFEIDNVRYTCEYINDTVVERNGVKFIEISLWAPVALSTDPLRDSIMLGNHITFSNPEYCGTFCVVSAENNKIFTLRSAAGNPSCSTN